MATSDSSPNQGADDDNARERDGRPALAEKMHLILPAVGTGVSIPIPAQRPYSQD